MEAETKIELKNCPFCGSGKVGFPFEDGDHINAWVTCYECDCCGPLVDIRTKNRLGIKKEAAEKWNERQ